MTDRIHALTVILTHDVREDDVEPLCDAIALLRGVLQVTTHVSDHTTVMAEARAKHELREKVWNVFKEAP
jgi:hypothetical protein